MPIGTTKHGFCNAIPFCSRALILIILCAQPTFGQTTNWTNLGTKPNVWADALNWSPSAPSTTSIAVIETGGTGSNLFLRESTSGIVDSGTIIFAHESYRNIIGGTGGATIGVINFGTSAFLDVDVPLVEPGIGARIGDVNGSGTANVIFSVPTGGSLTIRPMFAMNFNASIAGAGSVTFSSLDPDFPPATIIGPASQGSFTGGATISPIGRVRLEGSTYSSGGALTSGPFGVSTATLAGGTLQFSPAAASLTLGNAVQLTASSTLNHFQGEAHLTGLWNLSTGSGTTLVGRQLNVDVFGGTIIFNNASYFASDAGTIAILSTANGNTEFDVDFRVGTGTTSVFGGAVGLVTNFALNGLPLPDGSVTKSGGGEFAAKHFRVHVLDIDEGTVTANQSSSVAGGTPDFIGSTSGTSRVRRLRLDGVVNPSGSTPPGNAVPTVKLDLKNNDFIVDWRDKFSVSPLGTLTNNGSLGVGSTGYVGALRHAFVGNGTQLWSGNGITSSVAAANSGSFAIGYAESDSFFNISGDGTATFSDQVVSAQAVLFKFTYQGDFSLDGQVDNADFAILGSNFGTARMWTGGDSNYDGLADIGDFGQMAANWSAGTGGNNLRPGPDRLPPLGELYLLMLGHPAIYWEAKFRPDIWWRFEPFEEMNLGAPPAVPAYMLARGIPEPMSAGALAAMGLVAVSRRRQPVA